MNSINNTPRYAAICIHVEVINSILVDALKNPTMWNIKIDSAAGITTSATHSDQDIILLHMLDNRYSATMFDEVDDTVTNTVTNTATATTTVTNTGTNTVTGRGRKRKRKGQSSRFSRRQYRFIDGGVTVKKSTISKQMHGLFANRPFQKYEKLGYFTGTYLTGEQFKNKYKDRLPSRVVQVSKNSFIDAENYTENLVQFASTLTPKNKQYLNKQFNASKSIYIYIYIYICICICIYMFVNMFI
jgi:hypothetical protein